MKNPFKIQLKYLWVLLFLLALGVYAYLNSYYYFVNGTKCYRFNKWSGKLERRLTGIPPIELWINANEWYFIDLACKRKVNAIPSNTIDDLKNARTEELKKRGYL